MFKLYFGDISNAMIYCLLYKRMFNTCIKLGGYYMYFSTFEIYDIFNRHRLLVHNILDISWLLLSLNILGLKIE